MIGFLALCVVELPRQLLVLPDVPQAQAFNEEHSTWLMQPKALRLLYVKAATAYNRKDHAAAASSFGDLIDLPAVQMNPQLFKESAELLEQICNSLPHSDGRPPSGCSPQLRMQQHKESNEAVLNNAAAQAGKALARVSVTEFRDYVLALEEAGRGREIVAAIRAVVDTMHKQMLHSSLAKERHKLEIPPTSIMDPYQTMNVGAWPWGFSEPSFFLVKLTSQVFPGPTYIDVIKHIHTALGDRVGSYLGAL
jgi:hypothetical protein